MLYRKMTGKDELIAFREDSKEINRLRKAAKLRGGTLSDEIRKRLKRSWRKSELYG